MAIISNEQWQKKNKKQIAQNVEQNMQGYTPTQEPNWNNYLARHEEERRQAATYDPSTGSTVRAVTAEHAASTYADSKKKYQSNITQRRTNSAVQLVTDWLDTTSKYLTSGRADEKTRLALSMQHGNITDYLKRWGKDIDPDTLNEINRAVERMNAYLDPKTASQAFQSRRDENGNIINGSISAREYDRIRTGNPALEALAGNYMGNFDRYAKENPTQYVDNVNALQQSYNTQRAREILNQDPTRTSEYERAAQLSQYINSGGSLDGLSDSDKDKASALLEKWSQNKVNEDYNQRVDNQVDNTIDFSNEIGQSTPQGSNEIPIQQRTLAPLEASTNELAAAYNTTVLNRQKEKIADMVANDPGTALQYYAMYTHDMGKLGGSYRANDIASTATYNEAVTYGYLKATQGEEAAKKYWNALEGELMRRSAEKDIDYVADALGGSKFAHGVANLATQLGANANTIVGSLASPLTYLPGLDSYRQFTADMLQYQNAVKAQNAQEVAGDSKLARILWEGTSSGIENVVEAAAAGKIADSIGLTAVDPSLIGREGTLAYDGLLAQEKAREDFISVFVTLGMSSGAAMTAVEEGKAKGYSADEAAIRGLISGAIEFMTEKVGMDGVFKAVGEGRGALLAILKSGLAEGSEELVGNNLDRLATAIADAVTKKDASEYQQKVREYISQGMSETEAMQKVMLDYVDEDVEAFASAFFSAGMSAGGMGALTGNDIRTRREINYITNDAETRQAFIESGLESDKNTEAYKIANEIQEKLDSGEKVSPAEYEALYYANTRAEMGVADTVTGRAEIDMAEIARNEESTKAKETAPYQQTVKTAEGLKQLKNTLGSEGQKLFDNAINEAIRNKADVVQAYREVTNVYNAGAGVTNTYTATHLTADTTQALYKAGIADRETYAQEQNVPLNKALKPGVDYQSTALKSAIDDGRVSKAMVNRMDSLAKAVGARVVIDESSEKYNGNYIASDGSIHLFLDSEFIKDADTDRVLMATFGHEFAHRLQSLSPKHYEALTQAVVNTMGANTFNEAVNKYQAKAYNLNNSQVQDEVVADFIGQKVFDGDTEFINSLVDGINGNEQLTQKEKRTALETIKDLIHRVRGWFMRSSSPNNANALKDVEDRITDILREGRENLKSAREVAGDTGESRYSTKDIDDAYMKAVNSGDMTTAQRMVDEMAAQKGYPVFHLYHGSLNATFNVFDKSKAQVGGNSGAGFYFSTNIDDSEQNYADVEGADNWFKTQHLADQIMDSGEWMDEAVDDYDEAIRIAKEELQKTPGVYDVYLKIDNPYIRDYRRSTNIWDALYEDFDESLVDRDDYDSDEDYEDDLLQYRYEHIWEQVDRAVYNAYREVEDNYEVINGAYAQDIVQKLVDTVDDTLDWDTITQAIEEAGGIEVTNDNWGESADASYELARQIIEEFGYDGIQDEEVGRKFNQLIKSGAEDTEHFIAFHPNQIKSAEPVTYDDNGNVIPLSERFNESNPDIRYSRKATDESYMQAVEDGDMDTAQKMVDQAARNAGYTSPKLYHGTNAFGFTVIDTKESNDRISFFATDSEKTAGTYSGTDTARDISDDNTSSLGMYQLYANTDGFLELDAKNAQSNHIELGNIANDYNYFVNKKSWYSYATAKQIAQYAKKNGYPGVVIRNVIDTATPESRRGDAASNVYVFFNPQAQVKSADPVTYDGNGNVIPLSERFNESNQDIRYSTKDSEGKELTPAQQEYFKDSKVRDEDGNLMVMYHGTRADFTVFDPNVKPVNGRLLGDGFYFTDSRKTAIAWTKGYGKAIKAYLNMTNPFVVSDTMPVPQELIDAVDNSPLSKKDFAVYKGAPSILEKAKTSTALFQTFADNVFGESSTEVLKGFGYDGIIMRASENSDFNRISGDQWVVFDSNQIKKTTNKNPTENSDIRYSRKGSPQIDYDTAIQLQETNKQLKEEVERLRTEFKRKPIDVKDFSSRVTRTIRSYEGTVDAQEIIDSLLPDARKFVLNPNKENEAKLYGKIQDAAHKIITTALTRDEFSEAAQVREFLKGRRIKVSPKIKSDFGDWMRDYHQRYFGNLYFTNDKGTSVEDTYSELQGQFGEGMFPSYYTNPSDQLEHILEVYEAVDSYYNPYDGQTAEAIESLSMELVANVLDTKVKYTYADKMHDRIARLRAEKNQKYEDLKAHYREVAENARNRRDERETRRRLLNVAQRLERIKTTAANRALIESLIGDLDTISMGMTGQGFENLQNLSRWYDSIMEDPDFVRDPNIEEKIKRLNKKHINGITKNIGTYATLAEAKLAQKNYDGDGTTNIRKTPEGYILTAHEDVMSIEDVRELLDVLLNVENEIQTAKHLIDVEDRRDTFAMAQQIIEDIRQSSGVKNATAMFDKLIVQGTLSPERAIHRYTGYVENDPLYLATKNLSSGQRNMLDYQYRANKKFLKFTEDGKFMDEITGKKAKALKYKMKNIQGNEVEVAITPAMRISLYLHSLNSQNLKHIIAGGLTIPTWNDYVKGNLSEAYAGGTVVRLTPSQIRSITSQMTAKEMAFAKEVYDYFNGMSQDAINAVSEKLKGYALARVSDYFPINTDSNFLRKDYGQMQNDGTVQGMGFLKERIDAVNPVLLRDVNDVLMQSIQMTSKYVGLAIPVSNMNKLMKAQSGTWNEEANKWEVETSVQKELTDKWQKKATEYIDKMLSDVQNPQNTQTDFDKMFGKIRSNYAGAVLTLNLSVAMKQAASYPTAAAVVGWKALAKAMTQFGSVDLDLIARYTPLQWYRTQGYSTQELGDIKSRGKFMANLPKALNWIQAVDLLTTRKLWKAAEIYIQDNNKSLAVGTDEYYKAVAEIYNQIIEETQPNYTAMQRPELLRSNSAFTQAITMFKTQPFQNFNVTFDAVSNYFAKWKADKNLNTEQSRAELKQAQRKLSWAITSQVAQLFTFAAMTFLWNALRGKWKKYKDEEENLTVNSVSAGLAKDMASSLFSEVPLGAEAWEFISSKLFGDTYYGFDSVAVSALNDMVDAFNKASKAIGEFKDGEKNLNSTRLALDSAAKSITKVFGVPYENVENLFNIGFMNIAERLAPAFGGNKYEGHLAYLKLTVDPNKYKSDYYDNLIAAYENDKEAYKGIYDEMVSMDAFGEEKVRDKMDEYLKEKYDLKIKPSKYEGVEPETLQKISEALVKADANNEDPKKRNESYDMNEIYNALMELALDKQTAEKVWANEYGGGTTLDEYITAQEKKAEARSQLEDALGKAGVTMDEYNDVLDKMGSKSQANVFAALQDTDLSLSEKRAVWDTFGWKKSYDDYKKAYKEPKKTEPVEEPEEPEETETRSDVGYTAVSSTVLAGYEYHNGVLTVTLNSGRTYSYNVSQETFDAFEAADSKGSFWNHYIK